MKKRCWWPGDDEEYQRYHDEEWGFPVIGDIRLFEKICLEGFQSGLSWLTILRKREGFRRAFADFEFEKVARFDEQDVERLVLDAAIVRHRGKIQATINNAGRALEMRDEFGSLAAFFWQYQPTTEERPKTNTRQELVKVSKNATSIRLSKDLKKRGWKFVGPTTCYAFMQAMGIVNDHESSCWAFDAVEEARSECQYLE